MADKNILIVDDEKEIISTVSNFFAEEGYKVSVAPSGENALKELKTAFFQLAILDMKMPGLDGADLLREINGKYPDTKVIILTGYGEEYEDKVKGLRYDAFITKPFRVNNIIETAKEILSGKKVERQEYLLYNNPHIMPRAKLLFVEPSKIAVAGKKVYFVNKEKCGGEYEIDVIAKVKEIEGKLKEFQPDIVLCDISVLSVQEDLRLKIMRSKYKPKDIILFGHSSKNGEDDNFVEGQFDPMTAIFVKGMMDKLGKIVREASIAHGLYVRAKESVRIPGLELKEEGARTKEKKREITQDNLADFAKEIIARHLNVSTDIIKDDTNLIRDLGMNTIQSIQINIDLEDDLGFDILDNDIDKLVTFRQIVDYLRQRLNPR